MENQGCSVLGEEPFREEAETSGHSADVRPETTAPGEVCRLGFTALLFLRLYLKKIRPVRADGLV